jgi:hypothetical protein
MAEAFGVAGHVLATAQERWPYILTDTGVRAVDRDPVRSDQAGLRPDSRPRRREAGISAVVSL